MLFIVVIIVIRINKPVTYTFIKPALKPIRYNLVVPGITNK